MDKKMVSGLAMAAALVGTGEQKAYADTSEDNSSLVSQSQSGELKKAEEELLDATDTVAKAVSKVSTTQAAYDLAKSAHTRQEELVRTLESGLIENQYRVSEASENLANLQIIATQATPEIMASVRQQFNLTKASLAALKANQTQLENTLRTSETSLSNEEAILSNLQTSKNNLIKEIATLKDDVKNVTEAVGNRDLEAYFQTAQAALLATEELLTKAEKSLEQARLSDNQYEITSKQATESLKQAEVSYKVALADYETAKKVLEVASQKLQEAERLATEQPNTSQPESTPLYRTSEVSHPDLGNLLASVWGTFYQPSKDHILTRINTIRLEAFQSGLVDAFVPMKWSKALEEMAMIRVAESDVTHAHNRLTDKDWSSVEDPYPFEMWEESIGYTTASEGQAFLATIEQFYLEKGANYQALINPEYTHLGMAAFQLDEVEDTTAVLQLFANETSLDEAQVGTYGQVFQELEMQRRDVTAIAIQTGAEEIIVGSAPVPALLGGTLTSSFKGEKAPATVPVFFLKDVTWTSGNTSIATVDESGFITGLRSGTVTIRAVHQGLAYAKTLKVIAPADVVSAKTLRDKAEADFAITKDQLLRTERSLTLAKETVSFLENRQLEQPLAQERYDKAQAEYQKTKELTAKIQEALKIKNQAIVELATLNEKLTEKEADLDKVLARETLVSSRVTDLKKESSETRLALQQRQLEVQELEKTMAQLRQKLTELETNGNALQEAERELDEVTASLLAKQTALATAKETLTVLANKVDLLSHQLIVAKTSLQAAKDSHERLEKRYQSLVAVENSQKLLAKSYQEILDKGEIPVPIYNEYGQVVGYQAKAASSASSALSEPDNVGEKENVTIDETSKSPTDSIEKESRMSRTLPVTGDSSKEVVALSGAIGLTIASATALKRRREH